LCALASKNRVAGILGIALGAFFLISLFYIDINAFIIPLSEPFLAKYSMVILAGNCGITLIIFGFLHLTGKLAPYFPQDMTTLEKAKHDLLSVILSIPAWLSISCLVFFVSKGVTWKVLWGAVLIYVFWIGLSSIKSLKRKGNPGP